MKLHLVQMHPELNDKEANLAKILDYVDKGLEAGANLIAFGECALLGYELMGKVDYYGLAEPIPGPTTEKIAERIKGKHCLVILGMAERVRGDVYNAAALIGPEGVIGVARKLYLLHLWAKSSGRMYAEGIFFKAGERIAIFDTEFGRIGIQICLDNRHPEIAHAQAIAGCWLKIRPSAVPFRPEQPATSPLDLARAIENKTCDCFVNIVGDQGGILYKGATSVIMGSQGVKKQASFGKDAKEEVLEYEVDSSEVYAERERRPIISEVRPELFKQLWEIATEYQHGGSGKIWPED